MGLSKLHVRFIQSQKDFTIGSQTLPINQLYVKDMNTFYLALSNENNLQPNETLSFNAPTPALNSLKCVCDVAALATEAQEEALLFFQLKASKVWQLNIISLSDK